MARRFVTAQVVASGAASAAIGDTTRFLSITVADGGYFLVSAAGTIAAATDHRIEVGERVDVVVYPGEKISFLLDTAVNAYVSELA